MTPTGARGRTHREADVGRRVDALTQALHAETELVDELNDHLRRQRAGVAADDVAAVDDSVDAIGRVLHALAAARGRRASHVFELCGDETMPLDRLNEWLGEFAGPDFDAARAALRHAAAETAREAAINRKVLERATADGEAFLQELFSSVAGPEIYGPIETGDAAGPVMLNRRA
jgi:hypothetical protein